MLRHSRMSMNDVVCIMIDYANGINYGNKDV